MKKAIYIFFTILIFAGLAMFVSGLFLSDEFYDISKQVMRIGAIAFVIGTLGGLCYMAINDIIDNRDVTDFE